MAQQLPDAAPATISVVMVNFNGGGLLQQSVQALLASPLPLELWVVDNASTDRSFENLQTEYAGDSRVHLLANQQNLGFAVANNQALNKAQGDYLLLLNPDCLVQPDTLERMIETLQRYPEAGMAGCRILNPDGSEQAGCRRSLPTPGSGFARAFNLRRFSGKALEPKAIDLNTQPLPDQPVYVEAISGAFMLIRRAAYAATGGLDEEYFLHCEDLDWCKRFADKGWKILFVPDVEVVHHQGTCSEATPVRVSWHKHVGMARYYRKFLQSGHALPFNLLVYTGIYSRFAALAVISFAKKLVPGRAGQS